jgi:hypothetical protein
LASVIVCLAPKEKRFVPSQITSTKRPFINKAGKKNSAKLPAKAPDVDKAVEAKDTVSIGCPETGKKKTSLAKKIAWGAASGVALGAMVSAATGLPMIASAAVGSVFGAAGGSRWIGEYTAPRKHTAGDFKKASYFQAAMQGGTEGYYLLGAGGGIAGLAMGVGAGAGSASVGALVQNKTQNQALGLLAGTGTGVGLAAAVTALSGGALAPAMFLGGTIGLFQTIRAHGKSAVRDAGGNATMVSGLALNGPAKLAGGVGAAIGVQAKEKAEELHEKYGKKVPLLKKLSTENAGKVGQGIAGATVGAGVAAAMVLGFGSTLAAIGAPIALGTAVAASAGAGLVGPFVGPRFSQFFRNMAEDIGNGAAWAWNKMSGKEPNQKITNSVGSVPAAFIKEGIRGSQYMDGSDLKSFLTGFVVGGVMESAQQIHIMLKSDSKKETKCDDQKAEVAEKAVS